MLRWKRNCRGGGELTRTRIPEVMLRARSLRAPAMEEVFGPGGLLERCMIGGYEHRAAQLEMAEMVHDAFDSRHHAVVEAGTGTGKTLAYLLPAICSGRRVVISTATKSLQEQLYQKDIPFLQKHFAPELKVAVMKGRSNFLCRVKVAPDGGPADAERNGRDRRVPADSENGRS